MLWDWSLGTGFFMFCFMGAYPTRIPRGYALFIVCNWAPIVGLI